MLGCARAREAGRGTKFIHSFNLMSCACCRSVVMDDIREASNLEKIHTSQSDKAKEESGVEQPRAGFWRRYRRRFGSFLFVIILALAALTLLDLLNG